MRSTVASLLAATAIFGAAQAAAAADLPMKAPVHAAPAAFSWTGCYIGAHGGYGWGRNRNDFGVAVMSGPTEELFNTTEFGPFDHNTRGAVLGAQVGCNYQFQQNWVVGLEGEFAWSGIKGSFTAPEDEGVGNFSTFESRNRWNGDLALRLGYAMDRNLFYGKVGAAWGDFRYTETHDDFPTVHAASCGGGAKPCSVDVTNNRVGLLLGAGWEYAITNNWTAKIEYNYINYGSATIAYPSTTAAIQSFSVHDTVNVVKVGVNYLFH